MHFLPLAEGPALVTEPSFFAPVICSPLGAYPRRKPLRSPGRL